MIILDTDHATVMKYQNSERYIRLTSKLSTLNNEKIGTTIITIEEQMRGWLASIAKERYVQRQVSAYRNLSQLFDFFSVFEILPFDTQAADCFDRLNSTKIRIGTMDLKIASIALTNDFLLLTANRRDFEQIPGLKFENWID